MNVLAIKWDFIWTDFCFGVATKESKAGDYCLLKKEKPIGPGVLIEVCGAKEWLVIYYKDLFYKFPTFKHAFIILRLQTFHI